MPFGTQQAIIGRKISGGLSLHSFQLCVPQPLGNDRDDRSGNFVLELEDVDQITIVALRPDRRARSGVHQLYRYPHPLPTPPYAAFPDIVDAELPVQLLQAESILLHAESRSPGEHPEILKPRQLCDDFFGYPVGEDSVAGIRAEVFKWQHGDEGPRGLLFCLGPPLLGGRYLASFRNGHSVRSNGLVKPLDRLLSEAFIDECQAGWNRLADRTLNYDTARFGKLLEALGQHNACTRHGPVGNDHLAERDSDPHLGPYCIAQAGVVLAICRLEGQGGAHRIRGPLELSDQRVAT